ncbi:MAG: hypothetical protein HQ518_05310 [Rhodopirellula sp.]|nr:hypothetical protein [Rhodopirellula sp.]
MAKRKTTAVSKSAAIREYISANPSAGPTAIYDALTKQGIKVSKGLVSVVKYSKPKSGKRRGRPAKTQAASTMGVSEPLSSGSMPASDLIAAKELADSVGSIARVREALDLLEKLS